jgi:hypothetical protein
MSKKQSNPMPENVKRPKPPPGPPFRTMKETFFSGLIETKQSMQARHDYEMFMKGYRFALGKPNVPQPGEQL